MPARFKCDLLCSPTKEKLVKGQVYPQGTTTTTQRPTLPFLEQEESKKVEERSMGFFKLPVRSRGHSSQRSNKPLPPPTSPTLFHGQASKKLGGQKQKKKPGFDSLLLQAGYPPASSPFDEDHRGEIFSRFGFAAKLKIET